MVGERKVRLGGIDFLFVPLSPDRLKELNREVEELLSDNDILKRYEALILLAHASLSSNYPEMKLEEVEELLDLSNFNDVMKAITDLSNSVWPLKSNLMS